MYFAYYMGISFFYNQFKFLEKRMNLRLDKRLVGMEVR